MIYHSTRNNAEGVNAREALLKGLCDDGGLYVSDALLTGRFPMNELVGLSLSYLMTSRLTNWRWVLNAPMAKRLSRPRSRQSLAWVTNGCLSFTMVPRRPLRTWRFACYLSSCRPL